MDVLFLVTRDAVHCTYNNCSMYCHQVIRTMSSLFVEGKRLCTFVGTFSLSIDVDAQIIIQFIDNLMLCCFHLFLNHKVQQVNKDLRHMLLNLLSSQAVATAWRGS